MALYVADAHLHRTHLFRTGPSSPRMQNSSTTSATATATTNSPTPKAVAVIWPVAHQGAAGQSRL